MVGNATDYIALVIARRLVIKNRPLLMIAPVFNNKLHVLKMLVKLGMPDYMIKQYATGFSKTYRSEYQKLELAGKLSLFSDSTAIAHDESDKESAIADSIKFCERYPLTRLMVTKDTDHIRIINSESVWQELKSHLNYDDTTINFITEIVDQ